MCIQIEIIYQAIEFMESQLRSHIMLAQIAERCGYSLFYFIRTFNKVVHQTPYDYLITRRLSEALKMLCETDRRITDIALDFCFETPESFSRAFKRLFGILPSLCRKEEIPESVFPVPPKTLQDLQFINRNDFILPEWVEFEEMSLVGLSTEFTGWDQVKEIQQDGRLRTRLAGNSGGRKTEFFTVRSYTDNQWQHGYLFKGIETEKEMEIVPPITIQRIPSGLYARIFCRETDQQAALNYLLYTWMPRMGCKLKHRFLVEEARENDRSRVNRSIKIPVLMI